MTERVILDYYTDVLCVWAYVAQVKLDELRKEFGDQIVINYRFISLFGNTEKCIGQNEKRGGFQRYSTAVKKIASNFGHVTVHPEIWQGQVPPSSLPAHLYLNAVKLLEHEKTISAKPLDNFEGRSLFEEFVWRLRLAFFRHNRDIAAKTVLVNEAAALGIPIDAIESQIESGRAHAALASDTEERYARMIEGSPTYVMNEGRQKLYGNIGYLAIAANVRELLENPMGMPSWC